MQIFLDDQGIITRLNPGLEKIDPTQPMPAAAREELADQLLELRQGKGHGTVYLRALGRYAARLAERGAAKGLVDKALDLSRQQVPVDVSFFGFMVVLVKVISDCVRALDQ